MFAQADKDMTCFECDKTKLDKKLNRNWRYQGNTGSFDGHNLRHEVSATLTPSQLCGTQLSALLAECVAAQRVVGRSAARAASR